MVQERYWPVADEWAGDFAVHVAGPTSVIRYTAALRALFQTVEKHTKTAVLHSSPQHVLSPVTATAVELTGGFGLQRRYRYGKPGRAAAYWHIAEGPVGQQVFYNGLTGRMAGTRAELREVGDNPLHPRFAADAHPQQAALRFSVHRLRRPEEDVPMGALAEFLLPRLGGGAPEAWDLTEPLARPWNVTDVDASAEPLGGEPPFAVPAVYFTDGRGAWGSITVRRDEAGLIEHTSGSIPLGPYPQDVRPATDLATAAARDLAQAFPSCVQGFFSLRDVDPGLFRSVRPHVPDRALALLVGPRAAPDFTFWAEDPSYGDGRIDVVGSHPYQAGIVTFGGDDLL